ncbi:hypothetical protein FRC18_005826 [Serendipita sp. 400]|nr:hypothetical protein FRC18_005826 [Serendipita sp. 400]
MATTSQLAIDLELEEYYAAVRAQLDPGQGRRCREDKDGVHLRDVACVYTSNSDPKKVLKTIIDTTCKTNDDVSNAITLKVEVVHIS